MKHFKMLAVLLAVLTFATSSFAASGGGKHKTAKQTAVEEIKKFAPTTFFYSGTQPAGPSDIETTSNWLATGTACSPTGNSFLCSITFDDSQLDSHGKPNSTVLTTVANNLVTGGSTPHSYPVTNGTITVTITLTN